MRNRIIVLIAGLLFLSAAPVMATSRQEAVTWLSDEAFGLLQKQDFETAINDQGQVTSSVMDLEGSGLMAAVIGPEGKIGEISVTIKLREDNALLVPMFLAHISGQSFPKTPDIATEWTINSFSDLVQQGSGSRTVTDQGKTVSLKVVPPNIVIYNVVFQAH